MGGCGETKISCVWMLVEESRKRKWNYWKMYFSYLFVWKIGKSNFLTNLSLLFFSFFSSLFCMNIQTVKSFFLIIYILNFLSTFWGLNITLKGYPLLSHVVCSCWLFSILFSFACNIVIFKHKFCSIWFPPLAPWCPQQSHIANMYHLTNYMQLMQADERA